MLKFIVMLPFRILFLLFLKLTFWICTGLLCMTEWVFGLASRILLVMTAQFIWKTVEHNNTGSKASFLLPVCCYWIS